MADPAPTIAHLQEDPDLRVRHLCEKFAPLKVVKHDWVAIGRWLRYGLVRYGKEEEEKPLTWETVERARRNGPVDGVDVLALVRSKSSRATYLVLVINYRPPVGCVCIEFPSGLVDRGESPEEAGLRELKEETGLTGRVVRTSPILQIDPWKSNESTVMVEVEVDGDDPTNAGCLVQKLDEQEHVEPVLVPVSGLLERLQRYKEWGVLVDAKLYTLAHGWAFPPPSV